MDAKRCLHLGIFLYLAVILESRVIVPRSPDEEIPLSINPLEEDKKLGLKPAVWGPPTGDNENPDYSGIIDPPRPPLINDYEYESGRDIDKEDNRPGTNPERFPVNADRGGRPNERPEEKDDIDYSDDENFINIRDPVKFGSPDEDRSTNKEGDESEIGSADPEESDEEKNDKEHKPEDEEKPDEEQKEDEPVEDEEKPDEERKEDEPEPVEDDNKKHAPEDEEKPDEEESKDDSYDKGYKPEDEEKPDEEKKEDGNYEPENDDGKQFVPEEESIDDEKKEVDEGAVDHEDDKNGDANIPQEGESGFFSGGSIFDTPFFNLEQVKKYFSKMDRALGHVFRQTLDEALLLNGTYANTTEEEVDIGGKKYIITKSVLKGADNNSMMYVEALSTKPKKDDSEVVQNIDIKNDTST